MGNEANRGYGLQGYGSHAQWVTCTMGYMGNRVWGMGYKGYGPHGQWGTWAIMYRGMGYRTYGPHGQWGTRVWGTLGHMYSLIPSQ